VVVCDNITDNDCCFNVPPEKWVIDKEASFFYYCSNETVNGLELAFEDFPWEKIPSDCPVCIDMSSNIGTNHIPWDKVGVVFAGAQKNLGTAGCTVIIVREDLFGHKAPDTPILADWEVFEASPDKTYNTPAVYPMYITGLNCSYMNQNGGLDYYIMLANQRSMLLWDFIDRSEGYYASKVTDKKSRSRMNVIFRIQGGNVGLEEAFIKEAKEAGIVQIRGHTFNPGIRISMYNAMPLEGVAYLTEFMRRFKVKYPISNEPHNTKM
jgi:phosphoserine aminotransferase